MLGWMATAGLAGGMELALLGTAVLAAGPASFTVVERATTGRRDRFRGQRR